ncbi:MAG: altronate dehydratase family protein [Oscillospiraceae bacterium]|nr:altronate dehydratase family protein [Oscillospiraceae bacterium]
MDIIKIYPQDSVAVALRDLKAGETVAVDGKTVKVLQDIPNGHKLVVEAIKKGEAVLKYGNAIGTATEDVPVGGYIHDHNLVSACGERKHYTYNYDPDNTALRGASDKTFQGYARANGAVGCRNYLLIVPSVFCANGPLEKIARVISEKYPANANFDGVLALTHPYGCSQTGADLEMTSKTLASFMLNGNFGGVLIISCGCEVNDLTQMKKYMGGDFLESRTRKLCLQDADDEIAEAMQMCDELMAEISKDRREAVNMDKLHIAMNCGGSDGFSGVTANKILGRVCGRLVSEGATVNMTEVAEMIGGEHLLMNRAINEKVFQDIVDMINRNLDYYEGYGIKMNANPTQGNKAGGLSTIEDKSLGCIQKGGKCAVYECVQYGDRATQKGFILVDGPGNDLTGITAQIAAGAVLTVFTTGRGTPAGFGGPLYRLSSNNRLAAKKPGWIDLNCGTLLDDNSEAECQRLEDAMYEGIMQTVNGEYRTKNEINGYYQMCMLRIGPNM